MQIAWSLERLANKCLTQRAVQPQDETGMADATLGTHQLGTDHSDLLARSVVEHLL
ncbi:hypothetical protein D3C77_820430 [compost metagenome]